MERHHRITKIAIKVGDSHFDGDFEWLMKPCFASMLRRSFFGSLVRRITFWRHDVQFALDRWEFG